MKQLKLIALLLSFYTGAAFAFPKAPVDDLNFRPEQLFQFEEKQYDFEGIVKLSNCSGSLVQFEGQSDDAKAVVLTNGHCVKRGWFGGMIKPGEVLVNQKKNRSMKLFKNKDSLYNINATKIIYATMTDTDMALFELSETYNQIRNRTGVTPLTLSSTRSYEGVAIDVVSGYWERGYSCGIEKFVYVVKEAGWTFKDSIRYSPGCATIGGTSGSPIIEAGTRTVIGVNNSANESGRKCTMNNPCEVNKSGDVFVKKGLKYGQQTFNVYSCLNANMQLDMNKQGCALLK
jgi:V8-like Glu-specific endopeptidase